MKQLNKKIKMLAVSLMLMLTCNASAQIGDAVSSKVWNANDWTIGTDPTVEGLVMNGMTVETRSKGISHADFATEFTRQALVGTGGSSSYFKFKVKGNSTVNVYAIKKNTTTISICIDGTLQYTSEALTDGVNKVSYTYTGTEDAEVTVYSSTKDSKFVAISVEPYVAPIINRTWNVMDEAWTTGNNLTTTIDGMELTNISIATRDKAATHADFPGVSFTKTANTNSTDANSSFTFKVASNSMISIYVIKNTNSYLNVSINGTNDSRKLSADNIDKQVYYCTGNGEGEVKVYTTGKTSKFVAFKVEPIPNKELTSSANLQGYKTFYDADVAYEADENTKVYIAAAPSNNEVVVTPLETKVIPAKTPVLLKTTAADYNITLTPTSETVEAGTYNDNTLDVTTEATSNVYILAYTTAGGLGFYNYTGSLPAGSVYLPVSSSAARKLSVVLDGGEATVISAIGNDTTGAKNGNSYNFAGQKVAANYKGIVISNGKKVLIK